ncbi:hypothetical protein FGB62_87g056 [Gracilaria domingensis]|nr:hypothetical protein FGB62_87g056 [Gracilaria domingensis]
MLISPPAVQLVWVICYHYGGNAVLALSSPVDQILSNFPHVTLQAGAIVAAFLAMQLVLLRLIPATTFVAIPTPMGNRPTYRLNGVRCFFLTHFLIMVAYARGLFLFEQFYHVFGDMLAFLNAIALVVTVFLYFRGLYFPTNSDSGKTGHGVIWDMWQGTELHPEMFGVSLKQLINCRFAMMGWSVAVVGFAVSQHEMYGYVSNSMLVSTFLQMVYYTRPLWVLYFLGLLRVSAEYLHADLLLPDHSCDTMARVGGSSYCGDRRSSRGVQLLDGLPKASLPGSERQVQGVGTGARNHRGDVRDWGWKESPELAAGERLVGCGSAYQLRVRDHVGALLEPPCCAKWAHSVRVRELPDDPSDGSGVSRRAEVRGEVRQVLRGVLQAGAVQDGSRRVLIQLATEFCI